MLAHLPPCSLPAVLRCLLPSADRFKVLLHKSYTDHLTWHVDYRDQRRRMTRECVTNSMPTHFTVTSVEPRMVHNSPKKVFPRAEVVAACINSHTIYCLTHCPTTTCANALPSLRVPKRRLAASRGVFSAHKQPNNILAGSQSHLAVQARHRYPDV